MFIVGELFICEIFSRGNEVIKTCLSLLFLSCLVPFFSIFSTSSYICNAKDSIHIVHEDKIRSREIWLWINTESTICIKKSKSWFFRYWINRWKNTLFSNNEHRDFSSIFALIPYLVCDKIIQVYISKIYSWFVDKFWFEFRLIHINFIIVTCIGEWWITIIKICFIMFSTYWT